MTIITCIGRTWIFNFLLWRTCATERNWKPVLTFLQLYVQTWSSVFHSSPLLQVSLNSSVEPKCAVWLQSWVEQRQRRKSIVRCKRAFINVLKLGTPGCWATCLCRVKKDLSNQCVKVMFCRGGTLTSYSLNICHQFNLSGSSHMDSILQWTGNSQPRLVGCIWVTEITQTSCICSLLPYFMALTWSFFCCVWTSSSCERSHFCYEGCTRAQKGRGMCE